MVAASADPAGNVPASEVAPDAVRASLVAANEVASEAHLTARPAASMDQEVPFDLSDTELLQLLCMCPVAIIKLDLHGTVLMMNPHGVQMLMPLAANGKLANLFDLFAPFAPEVAEMARRFPNRSGKICEEHRIRLPIASVRGRDAIISVTLQKVVRDTYIAVLTDVTSAAAREVLVRESEERLHAVLDGLKNHAVCTVDASGIITSCNKAAERLNDYRIEEAIGKHLDMLIPVAGSVRSPMKRRLELALRDGSHNFEGWRVRKDGRRYWAATSVSALHSKDGKTLIGFSVITQDLTEQRRAEDKLRELATTDPLTGILNRRSFFETAERERVRVSSRNGPVAVLMLDADYFKLVNDEHGHDAGDATLRRIVADCRKEIRSGDILGRFGGEEFAILLPAATRETGRSVAERIRERVAESGRQLGNFPCTVSIGVSFSPSASESIGELILRADAALYSAKAAGRNRVVVSEGKPAPT